MLLGQINVWRDLGADLSSHGVFQIPVSSAPVRLCDRVMSLASR